MTLHMDTPISLSPDTDPNNGGDTKLDPKVLLRALRALRKGQFSTRIATGSMSGVDREIASTLNDVISLHETAVYEIARVSIAVGKEGKVAERGVLVNAEGSWKELIDSTNNLIADTIRPTVETSRVIEAVVKGDLSQMVSLEHDGRPLLGEFYRLGKVVNTMVEELNSFTSEATLGDTLKTLALRAHQKQLELICDIQPEIPDRLIGDPGRLRQVITNLIGNAIKFTHEGEVALTVEMQTCDDDEVQLYFAVNDTGIGIPAGKLNVIFEAFSQADGSITRKYGGTGLGLTISTRLVELMHGHLQAESVPDQGSVFHFTARFARSKTPDRITLPAPPANLSSAPVLVVDDNATNRRVLHRMLSSWGMKPVLAENGDAAMTMLRQSVEAKTPYQFILIDSQMPGQMEGFMVAEYIKQSPHFAKSTTIMLMSTAQRERGAGEAPNSHAAISLTKPVGHTELLNALVQPTTTNQPSVKPATQPRSQPSEPHSGAHILLAEDNTVNQKLAIRLLERFGYKVTLAENGLQAVAAAEKQQFDLVLMDVQMPEMGGFEATAIIRDREALQNRHTPIIAMTAHALQGDREKCLEARMDDYLSKPIRADQLKAMIEKFLNAETNGEGKTIPKPTPAPTTTTTTTTQHSSKNPTGLDPALLSEIAPHFLHSYPQLMKSIELAIANYDTDLLQRTAHSLKGAVGNFSSDVEKAALDLELIGKHRGSLKDAQNLYEVLNKKMDKLIPTIKALADSTHI